MYLNIFKEDQQQQENNNVMSVVLNATKSASSKVDCAKECPCGVPAIPVPDQWLEVMVTGGFKVWHIIFIIIAFVVTLVVVYCCFHRCRIPRTKQEIEADLMRSNIANKFRDYLQELPNEPTSFMEALKKVQDIEEKLEADDAQMSRDLGAKKRMGWLKLRAKDKAAETTANETGEPLEVPPETGVEATTEAVPPAASGNEQPNAGAAAASAVIQIEPESQPPPPGEPLEMKATDSSSKPADTAKTKSSKKEANKPSAKVVKAEDATKTKTKAAIDPTEVNVNKQSTGAPKVRRKRDKPNLSRTKATHLRTDHVESMDIHNHQLELELPPQPPPPPPLVQPPASHKHEQQPESKAAKEQPRNQQLAPPPPVASSSAQRPARAKTKGRQHSTGAAPHSSTPSNKHD